MYTLRLIHNNGTEKQLSFSNEKQILGYLFNSIDISRAYLEAEEVPNFFVNEESEEVYGKAKNVYNPFDEQFHFFNGDYDFCIEKKFITSKS